MEKKVFENAQSICIHNMLFMAGPLVIIRMVHLLFLNDITFSLDRTKKKCVFNFQSATLLWASQFLANNKYIKGFGLTRKKNNIYDMHLYSTISDTVCARWWPYLCIFFSFFFAVVIYFIVIFWKINFNSKVQWLVYGSRSIW